jgi:hypothetical protein
MHRWIYGKENKSTNVYIRVHEPNDILTAQAFERLLFGEEKERLQELSALSYVLLRADLNLQAAESVYGSEICMYVCMSVFECDCEYMRILRQPGASVTLRFVRCVYVCMNA